MGRFPLTAFWWVLGLLIMCSEHALRMKLDIVGQRPRNKAISISATRAVLGMLSAIGVLLASALSRESHSQSGLPVVLNREPPPPLSTLSTLERTPESPQCIRTCVLGVFERGYLWNLRLLWPSLWSATCTAGSILEVFCSLGHDPVFVESSEFFLPTPAKGAESRGHRRKVAEIRGTSRKFAESRGKSRKVAQIRGTSRKWAERGHTTTCSSGCTWQSAQTHPAPAQMVFQFCRRLCCTWAQQTRK